MHREQRGGSLGDGRGDGVGGQVQRHGIDVDEHRSGALVHRDIGAGHERERRGDDLIAIRHPNRPQRQMKPRRPARHRAGKRSSHKARKRSLELRQQRSERQPAGSEHLEHTRFLLRPDHRLGKGDWVDRHE